MAARIAKGDLNTLESFGFEVSEPPAKDTHRRSRHHDRFLAARDFCMKYEGTSVKILDCNTQSTAYTNAKRINNGENTVFPDFHDWKAVAAPVLVEEEDGTEVESGYYGVWLTYAPRAES